MQHEIGHHRNVRRLGTCLVSQHGCRDQLEEASGPLLLWRCHLSGVSAKTVGMWMISEGTLLLRLHGLDERTERTPFSRLIYVIVYTKCPPSGSWRNHNPRLGP